MKSVISLFFMVSYAFASPINLYYESDPDEAEIYKAAMIRIHMIPEELIELKKASQCEGIKKKGKFDLCLKKNGDLFEVSIDRHFIEESLKVFQSP
jgi:hypothetical protein